MKKHILFHLQANEQIELQDGEMIFGRSTHKTYAITDERISSKHFKILNIGTSILLEDMGSKNGTKVNGRAVSGKIVLKAKDEIEVGSQKFIYIDDDDEVTMVAKTNIDKTVLNKEQTLPASPHKLEKETSHDNDANVESKSEKSTSIKPPLPFKVGTMVPGTVHEEVSVEERIKELKEDRRIFSEKKVAKERLLSIRKEISSKYGKDFETLIVKTEKNEKEAVDEILLMKKKINILEQQLVLYKQSLIFAENEKALAEHEEINYDEAISKVDESLVALLKQSESAKNTHDDSKVIKKKALESEIAELQAKLSKLKS